MVLALYHLENYTLK